MTTALSSADILPSAPTHAGGIPQLVPPAVLSSAFDSIADSPAVNIPIALEVPWNGTLPDAAALVCRTLTDDITATCCLYLNGEAQTRSWTLGDPGLGNSSAVGASATGDGTSAAPASSAPAPSGSLAARATVTADTPANITTRLTLCALPSTANTSAFEVCAREQGAYNTTAMCYDPKDKDKSEGVRVGVGMGVLGVLAVSVLAAF